jgi:phosphoglycolate phosphatase-like HAD superfamily hydrolase
VKKILLWDIDGTLIRTSRAGLYAFEEATVSMWGRSISFADIESAGMTDHYIAAQVVRKLAGRDAEEDEIVALTNRYESLLQQHLDKRAGWVLPSVREILEELGARDDYTMLILTGNSETGARVKLRHLQLDHHFDFAHSAFCDKEEKRMDIAARAHKNVLKLHGANEDFKTVVIGDTPNDILVGKNIGARTVGVATGTFSVEELQVHEPWWTVRELPSVETFAAKMEE